jgi:uncharacterized protein YpbB
MWNAVQRIQQEKPHHSWSQLRSIRWDLVDVTYWQVRLSRA